MVFGFISMFGFISTLDRLDEAALDAVTGVRWAPISGVLVVASAWWFKGFVFVGLGALADLKRRSLVPLAALAGAVSFGIASGIVAGVKDTVDRARPAVADPTFETLIATPSSPSFPSGHAATAFAAAVAIGVLFPRLRWPLVGLAVFVAFSRVYLGVHYWLDVLVGSLLGVAIGFGVAWAMRRVLRPVPSGPTPA